MKNLKNFFSILAIVVLSIITVHYSTINQANAQCPPEPDCFSDIFTPGTPIVIMNGACTTTVNWCWRFACSTYNDFVVTSIVKTGTCPGPLTDAQVQEEALKQAILLNPWGTSGEVPPCPEQSRVTWRLGKLACVAEYQSIENGFIIQWPCEPQSRCWERYTSCYEIDPTTGVKKINLTYLGSSFPAIPCWQTSAPSSLPLPFPVVLIQDCHSICQ